MDNKNIFAKNLKYYMDLQRKTRKKVCEDLGFSYYTFSDWVNGKKYPRMDKVEILANYFGILKSDLIEDKTSTNNIGSKIKQLRNNKNKTIYEMADEIGIEPSILVQYENGMKQIPNDVLEKMAEYFGTTIDSIYAIDLEVNSKQAIITTTDEILAKQYERWKKEIGYGYNFSNNQINSLIDFAKLLKKMTDNEVEQTLKYAEFLISQRKK